MKKSFSKSYMLTVFKEYLSKLTPRQKEMATKRIFDLSYREYFEIISEDLRLSA